MIENNVVVLPLPVGPAQRYKSHDPDSADAARGTFVESTLVRGDSEYGRSINKNNATEGISVSASIGNNKIQWSADSSPVGGSIRESSRNAPFSARPCRR